MPHQNSVFHAMLKLLPWGEFDQAVTGLVRLVPSIRSRPPHTKPRLIRANNG